MNVNCRPFATNEQYVGNPQSVLLNGMGFYGDCALLSFFANGTVPCNVTTVSVNNSASVQQPQASTTNPCAPWMTKSQSMMGVKYVVRKVVISPHCVSCPEVAVTHFLSGEFLMLPRSW